MPKTEEGEFELILGNRQLLSVFFIVVVLLGVFFTMGYIVGRNSAPAEAEIARTTEPKPIVVDRDTQPSPAGERIAPPATAQDSQPRGAGAESAKAAPPDGAAPRQEQPPPSASESKPAEPAQTSREKPAPASASPTPGEPQTGASYLQVAAVARPEAELFVDVLARRGFHAIYVQHPDQPQLYRVLVGPFRDPAAVAQARTDLNNAGFKGFEALARKY